MQFLVYNNYDNHISERFIYYYIQYNIILILLSSHYFHLLQSFNINIFNSLKSILLNKFDYIFRTGISIL